MTKKEGMKKAAGNSRKISDWIKPRKEQETETVLMDWSDDPTSLVVRWSSILNGRKLPG